MKSRMRSAFWMLSMLGALTVLVSVESAAAVTGQSQELNPESIAERSLSVAETMRSSGYCYAGVSKALSPLGVTLTGTAAYQAREQLLADTRFMAISLDGNNELRRGDIIVFNKSATHPYGHICVYQGNENESSDHVSQLTSPNAYGGVTVFRLRWDNNAVASYVDQSQWTYKMPVSAPDFRRSNIASSYRDGVKPKTTGYGGSDTKSDDTVKSATEFVGRHFHIVNASPTGKVLTGKLIRFVMRNL